MSPPGCQKMSAKPCNRNAEESFPVLSLKSREQKPPNPLLIQDKDVLQPTQRVPAEPSVSKTLYPDAAQRQRPRPCLCSARWHARASVGCLCSRHKTTSHPSLPPLRQRALCPRPPRLGSACVAKRCSPTPA